MRLLIIEDDPDLRRLLGEILDEEGYALDLAADGQEGLALATSSPYDAIVLDLMLPKLPGLELLHRLRTTHKTPVLILSARDALPDRVAGLDQGADDYLVKPFERSELLARLRALIRRAAGQAESVIQLSSVTIDLRAKQATVHGEEVHLTAREYALLEFLAVHRGRVVSRTELYDHLFDAGEDSLSNLLDVHVSNLRRKLGQNLIETRRGQGYVIP
jgi:two-component system OmpR family response regulator